MRRGMLFGLILALGIVFVAPAFAVPPAYQGHLGNNEEPALRPYKWFWHGLKAFFYNPIARLSEGNARYPGLGTVNLGKGVAQGAVELGESTYRGATYTPPPNRRGAYREHGTVNTYLENQQFFATVLDLPLVPMRIVEKPENAQARQEAVLEKAAQIRAARKTERESKAGDKTSFERDRASYIGDLANINKKPKAERDLTKRF
jgi:hypothetical protein